MQDDDTGSRAAREPFPPLFGRVVVRFDRSLSRSMRDLAIMRLSSDVRLLLAISSQSLAENLISHFHTEMRETVANCTGNARVKDCLEDHRDDPGFSQECKEEFELMMEARAADFRLDSSLREKCADDIEDVCGVVKVSPGPLLLV